MFVDDASQRASGNLQGVILGFSGSVVYGIGKLLGKKPDTKKVEKPTSPATSRNDHESERVILMNSEPSSPK